jgi:hypothetical protein
MMSILYSLSLLKRGRLYLVNLFLENSPSLYENMFKYRKNNVAMDLCKDKYFSEWIDYHFEMLKNDNVNKIDFKMGLYCVQKMLGFKNLTSSFSESITQKRILLIQSILESEDKMQQKMNKLFLAYVRDRDLFERKLEEYENLNI